MTVSWLFGHCIHCFIKTTDLLISKFGKRASPVHWPKIHSFQISSETLKKAHPATCYPPPPPPPQPHVLFLCSQLLGTSSGWTEGLGDWTQLGQKTPHFFSQTLLFLLLPFAEGFECYLRGGKK